MTHQVLDPVHPDQERSVRISPVTGRIGAEVCGVHLSGSLGEHLVEQIRRALLRHKVLFFRDQRHLDFDGQVAFARRLGDPAAPQIIGADHGSGPLAGGWHTDGSHTPRPPKAVLLRAVEVPAHGGDTVWANTAAAYDDLPLELRDLADRLWVMHSDAEGRETEHPLVRVHPETGERALLLGASARNVVGLSDQSDSEALIRLFQEHAIRLENTVRWRWTPGDVALWDNRATQRRVVRDYGDQQRRLRRVTLAGDTPLPVTGSHSC